MFDKNTILRSALLSTMLVMRGLVSQEAGMDDDRDAANALWEWSLSGIQAATVFGLVIALCIGARILGYP